MNVVKFCLLPVLVLILLAAGGLFFWSGSLPADWGSEASVTVDATPAEVHPFVADLREWPRWDRYFQESEGAQIRFEEDGRRAVVDVSGTEDADDPSSNMICEIVERDPAAGVTVRTTTGEGQELWTTRIAYEAVESGTRVTYAFGGSADGRLEKISGWVIQTGLGEYAPLSLESLAELVESDATPEHGGASGAAESDPSKDADTSDQ